MASTINASSSGSGGLISTGDASGVLQLQNNGTAAVTVDTSSRVGILTASPEASLQVNGTNGQIILSAGNAPSSGASTNKWRLGLREIVEGDFNILHYNGTSYDNIVNIQPAGQARFINTIGVGNTGGSTSGAGITFPATQSASSNANTLDDYEEGTWTPTYVFSGGNGTAIFNLSASTYTKIGNMVFLNLYFDFSKGTASGNFTITGVPFSANTRSPCSIVFDGGGAASTVVTSEIETSTIYFYASPQSTSYASALNATQMNATPYPRITCFYRIA